MTISNAGNIFVPPSFMVDPVLGQGTHTTVQSAINAAHTVFLATGLEQTVYLRDAQYSENLTIQEGVNLVGGAGAGAVIIGHHVWAGNGVKPTFSNMAFECADGNPMFLCNPGMQVGATWQNCFFQVTSSSQLFSFNAQGDFNWLFEDCFVIIQNGGMVSGTITDGSAIFKNSIILSPGGNTDWFLASVQGGLQLQYCFCLLGAVSSGSASLNVFYTILSCSGTTSNVVVNDGASAALAESGLMGGATNVVLNSASSAVLFKAFLGSGNSNVIQINNTALMTADDIFISQANSFPAIAGTGTFRYDHLAFNFLLTDTIDPGLTTQVLDTRPYASAGTSYLTATRGHCSFNSAQFTVDAHGWVSAIGGGGGGANSFQLDSGPNATPVGGVIQVSGITGAGFVPSGIETHNGGGSGNDIFIEDRRWLSQYVVDSTATIGARGTFATVQSAINAANANGGGTIYVRFTGSAYLENLTLEPNINLIGVSVDGRTYQGTNPQVVIEGNHTYTNTSTTGLIACRGISFISSAGDTFTVSNAAGNSAIAFENCLVTAAGGNAVTIAPTASAKSSIYTNFSSFKSTTAYAISLSGSSSYMIYNCGLNSNGLGCITDSSTQAATNIIQDCQIDNNGGANAFPCININSTTDETFVFDNYISGGVSGINFAAAGAVLANGNIYNVNGMAGNYIAGAAGNYAYTNETNIGSAKAIAVGITQTPKDWKPYATAGSALTAIRGTAGFDATHFTVTNGWVTLSGGVGAGTITGNTGGPLSQTASNWNIFGNSGAVTSGTGSTLTVSAPLYSDVGISSGVSANSGSFVTVAATLTLPVTAGLVDGDLCEIICTVAGPIVVQAQAGQLIRVGTAISSSGGTATNSSIGDTLCLRFRVADQTWYSNATTGVWVLA